MSKKESAILPAQILTVRDQLVLFDVDLARLYGVTTKALNQALRRNKERFPSDFVFQLSRSEFENLRSQFVTSRSHGGRRYRPWVLTHDAALRDLYQKLRPLLLPPLDQPKPRIGFHSEKQ